MGIPETRHSDEFTSKDSENLHHHRMEPALSSKTLIGEILKTSQSLHSWKSFTGTLYNIRPIFPLKGIVNGIVAHTLEFCELQGCR